MIVMIMIKGYMDANAIVMIFDDDMMCIAFLHPWHILMMMGLRSVFEVASIPLYGLKFLTFLTAP